MNNKKGFTLIELLAVIVILAIIALIVTPIVTGIISQAKKSAFKSTAQSVADAISNKCMINSMNGQNATGIYSVGNYDIGSYDIETSGKMPEKGIVQIDDKCIVKMIASDGINTVTVNNKTVSEVSNDTPISVNASKLKVVGIGDSLAAGYESDGSNHGGYNKLLENYLSNIDRLGEYKNASEEGTVIQSWIDLINNKSIVKPYNGASFSPAYDYASLLSTADVVTLSIGGNDALIMLKSNLEESAIAPAVEEYKERLSSLFDLIDSKTSGKVIYFGLYNPIIPDIYPEYAPYNELIDKWINIINSNTKEECIKHNFDYVDGYELFKNHIPEYVPVKDNVHPTMEGYKAITNGFIKYIARY